jgi:glycosyltransferase involved in cell wall biosynthesis
VSFSICFITLELFNWGQYGGIGKATRKIGAELVRRGFHVSVVMPRGRRQKKREFLDGMEVVSFPISNYPFTSKLYKDTKAEFFHSQEPSWGTIISQKCCPEKKHIVTVQNPRTASEWNDVYQFYLPRRRIFNQIFQGKIKRAVQKSTRVICPAQFTLGKTKTIYNLTNNPLFIPNPIDIPSKTSKSSTPTVIFLGRLDGEKRPDHFFALAKQFPEVDFLVLGKSHDPRMQKSYEGMSCKIANLHLLGFLDGDEKDEVLSKSWILVNTSVSECLPISFLEAAAFKCAILSYHNPDGFTSRGGYHVTENTLSKGLQYLLEDDKWKKKGEKGYNYVKKVHETSKVIDQHLKLYE